MAKEMTKTIPLEFPVEHDGQQLTTITLRRAKTKDIRALDAARKDIGEAEQGILMVQLLSGLPPEVVDEIDAEDFTKISEAVADFFGGKQLGSLTGDQ